MIEEKTKKAAFTPDRKLFRGNMSMSDDPSAPVQIQDINVINVKKRSIALPVHLVHVASIIGISC